MRLILDLCGGTASWSKPYKDEGCRVIVVDPLVNGTDVRMFKIPNEPVHGILAAPPCTHFAGSGARWWAGKGDAPLLEGLSIVDACLRIIAVCNPKWWALENPVGRLSQYLGKPTMYFHPHEYGGYSGPEDGYTKKTCLWGNFNHPKKLPIPAALGSKMHLLPPSPDRWRLRSATPAGFAQAFYEANP